MYSHQQEQTQHRRHNQACHPCRRAPPPTQHRRSPHLCRNHRSSRLVSRHITHITCTTHSNASMPQPTPPVASPAPLPTPARRQPPLPNVRLALLIAIVVLYSFLRFYFTATTTTTTITTTTTPTTTTTTTTGTDGWRHVSFYQFHRWSKFTRLSPSTQTLRSILFVFVYSLFFKNFVQFF